MKREGCFPPQITFLIKGLAKRRCIGCLVLLAACKSPSRTTTTTQIAMSRHSKRHDSGPADHPRPLGDIITEEWF